MTNLKIDVDNIQEVSSLKEIFLLFKQHQDYTSLYKPHYHSVETTLDAFLDHWSARLGKEYELASLIKTRIEHFQFIDRNTRVGVFTFTDVGSYLEKYFKVKNAFFVKKEQGSIKVFFYYKEDWFTDFETKILSQDMCERGFYERPEKVERYYSVEYLESLFTTFYWNIEEGFLCKNMLSMFLHKYKPFEEERTTKVVEDNKRLQFLIDRFNLQIDGVVSCIEGGKVPEFSIDDLFCTDSNSLNNMFTKGCFINYEQLLLRLLESFSLARDGKQGTFYSVKYRINNKTETSHSFLHPSSICTLENNDGSFADIIVANPREYSRDSDYHKYKMEMENFLAKIRNTISKIAPGVTVESVITITPQSLDDHIAYYKNTLKATDGNGHKIDVNYIPLCILYMIKKQNVSFIKKYSEVREADKPKLEEDTSEAVFQRLEAAVNRLEHSVITNSLVNNLTTTKVEKKKMEFKEVVTIVKDDAKDAMWRTSGRQFVKLAQEPLVALLQGRLAPGDETMRLRIAEFLQTDLGKAVVGSLLSIGLMAIPGDAKLKEVADRLSKEIRVESMSLVGGVVAEVIMGPLRQVISTYLMGNMDDLLEKTVPKELMSAPITASTSNVVEIEHAVAKKIS